MTPAPACYSSAIMGAKLDRMSASMEDMLQDIHDLPGAIARAVVHTRMTTT